MADKVLLLRWSGSAYDSLGGLLELIAAELAALGLNVVPFAAAGQSSPRELFQVLNEGDVAFALTMSGIDSELTVDGISVWEAARVPLFNWNCDHPCYYPSRHVIRHPFLMHGYVFPDHARYAMAHLNPNGMAFAVHLGIPPRGLFPEAPLPRRGRNGRIMFTKSGQDTNTIEAGWRAYAPEPRAIVFAAAEELLHGSTADMLPVLRRIAEGRGIFLDGASRLAMLLIGQLDGYIRFRRANLVMETVMRHKVDVFGSGWDHIKRDGARARFHGATTWRAMIGQLPSYVGCLSTNPLVEESVHDRVFFALAANVVPISEENGFSRTHMPALGRYSFGFTRERIEQAVDAVLADPNEALAHTESTWQALAIPFGMRRAAHQIVQFATMHGLNARYGA